MTHFTIKREQERQRRERLARIEERQRLENLKTESAKAERQASREILDAYQANTYWQHVLRLLALRRDLGCD